MPIKIWFFLKIIIVKWVIVEIDENQHQSYNQICECARLTEIVSAIGGISIVFIRFNTDVIKNNGNIINIPIVDRLNLLIDVLKDIWYFWNTINTIIL